MNAFYLFSMFVFITLIILYKNERQKNAIKGQVDLLGGTVITIEKKLFDNGPFPFKGKGRTIYRFEYKVDDRVNVGWVKFGGIFGPDWRM